MMEEQKRELTFLSYAHGDLDRVWKVYEGLKKRNVSVWFDKANLGPGKWKPQIEKQIPRCRYFIFCVSQASIKKTEEGTGFVEEELQTAWKIAEAQDERKFTIVPIRLEECGHGDHRLSTFQQFDLFEDFEKVLDELAKIIGGSALSEAKAADERTEDEKLTESIINKASTLFFSGEYEKTISMCEVVTLIEPENEIAWNLMGLSLNRLGRREKALKAYEKAIKIDTGDYNVWYNKGIVLDALGRKEEALEAFDFSIRSKKGHYVESYKKRVFISYVRENSKEVERVCDILGDHKINYWIDKDHIEPGKFWKDAIRDAIKKGAYFIAFFSNEILNKSETYMNDEISYAIEILKRKPYNIGWFLPVLLNECKLPEIEIGGSRNLSDIQAILLYKGWDNEVKKLLKQIKK
jgi:tetratricopeptide (TPR) repeat protein